MNQSFTALMIAACLSTQAHASTINIDTLTQGFFSDNMTIIFMNNEAPSVMPQMNAAPKPKPTTQEAHLTLRNSTPAFMDVALFNAQGEHTKSITCGGTFSADKVRHHTIPSDTTKLVIHNNFSNGSETVMLTEKGGFDGKQVHCHRNGWGPVRCQAN